MSLVNIIMPKLGEGIMEATVLKWHKKVGEHVKVDETLLEIATDKVDSEVPSTAEGILEELLCKENDVIQIGSVLARIRVGNQENNLPPDPGFDAGTKPEPVSEIPYQPSQYNVSVKPENGRFYSPLVMNIASKEGIPLGELEHIKGTGNDGRVTKNDILGYLGQKQGSPDWQPGSSTSSASIKQNDKQIPALAQNQQEEFSGNVQVVEMDRMRKLIADHMTRSKATSAHVTSFAEADVTNLVQWREKNKHAFEKREGEKITFTPLFVEAIVKSLKKFPMLNASVSGDKILIKKDINIGMATALPNGNLIVPVIKHADQYNIIGIAKQVNKLSENARKGKLQPADTQEGTFTFTNIGTFGSLMGTPIINQPQVAILATGAIKKKPVVVETEKGDSIAIRQMMFVSLSYDHRIIDGGLGSQFLEDFVKNLEGFDPERTF